MRGKEKGRKKKAEWSNEQCKKKKKKEECRSR